MPVSSMVMASNLKMQTAATKLDISMQKFVDAKSKFVSSTPLRRSQGPPNLNNSSKLQISPRKSFSASRTDLSSSHAKLHGKRRYSFTAGSGDGGKNNSVPFKRRKQERFFIPPTKFLLGGNINDPLNLGSLADEEINKSLNEVTPYSSPVPTPKHRTQVEVLIPPNINDPLNLNAIDDNVELELNLISPKTKRRKNRKRKKHGSGEAQIEGLVTSTSAATTSSEAEKVLEYNEAEPEENIPDEHEVVSSGVNTGAATSLSASPSVPTTLKLNDDSSRLLYNKPKRGNTKIVSPVFPQPGPRKRSNTYTRSVSREPDGEGEKLEPVGLQAKYSSSKRGFHKRHNSSRDSLKTMNFRKKDAQFQYGNYNRYYGYRNPSQDKDPRLQSMRREWFEGKNVLDIGCNVGFLTLSIAKDFMPKKIIGFDIDARLVKVAKKNIRHYLTEEVKGCSEFPISLAICHGPVATPAAVEDAKAMPNFPNNVFFMQGNYVLDYDELLETQRPEFETILCLSLTKWVHLNWGDIGLKRLFKRMYAQLHPGGRMLLEAQAWPSYGKKKKMTETTLYNYQHIQLRPEQFTEYLLSREVGFSTCEVIDTPFNASKGFRRPIQLFTKGETMSPKQEVFQMTQTESSLP